MIRCCGVSVLRCQIIKLFHHVTFYSFDIQIFLFACKYFGQALISLCDCQLSLNLIIVFMRWFKAHNFGFILIHFDVVNQSSKNGVFDRHIRIFERTFAERKNGKTKKQVYEFSRYNKTFVGLRRN